MIVLPRYFASFPCLCPLFLYLCLITKLWYTQSGSRSWIMRWMPSSHIKLRILCLLPLDSSWSVVAGCSNINYCPDGTMDGYKACLVARGLFRLMKWTIWRPLVARLNSFCVLFSLAANHLCGLCFNGCEECIFVWWPWRRSTWSNLLGMLLRGRILCASLRRQYMILSRVHKSGLISSVVSSLKLVFRSAILKILSSFV